MTREDIKTITDIVHKTIYGFFDVCGDDEETPMTDKDKLLLKINKAICTNIRALEQEPKTGHWIEYTRVLIPEPFNSWEQAWYCSECGYGNQECVDGSAWLEWKYCPNCGARMAESEE